MIVAAAVRLIALVSFVLLVTGLITRDWGVTLAGLGGFSGAFAVWWTLAEVGVIDRS